MRKSLIYRTSAVAAGSALLFGLAACSTDDAQDAANDATSAVTSAATEATDSASDAAADATDAIGGDDHAGEEVAEADLPAEITDAAANHEAYDAGSGEFVSAHRDGDNYVAEYENVTFVSSPETGVQPLIGKIRDTWVEGGGLHNEIGLPTEPERVIDNGWEQNFTNGTIIWALDEAGNYTATFA